MLGLYRKVVFFLIFSVLFCSSTVFAQTVCMSEQGICDCDYSNLQVDTEGLCQSVFIYNENSELIGIDCPDPESPCKDDPNFPNLWKECSNGRENTRCLTKGVWRCNDDTGNVYCTAEIIEPESEVCDGIDNDCDGKPDQDFDVGAVCSVGLGVCKGDGVKVCSTDGRSTVCNATENTSNKSDYEVCGNKKDDDCNGEVDEGFDDLGEDCYVGFGVCKGDGKMVCSTDGSSTVCNAKENTSNKSAETCANIGIDNDCDGETDDVDGLGDSCTDAPYDNKTDNNCIDTGTYQCVDGALKCSAKAPTKGETDVFGNNIDDDCDGETDEDYLNSCDELDGSSVLNDFYITNNYKVKKTSGSNVGKSYYKEGATGTYNNSDYLSYHVATGVTTIRQQGQSTADYGYNSQSPSSIANIVCIKNPNGIKNESEHQWEKIIGDKEDQGITKTEKTYNYNDVETQYSDLDLEILNGMSVKDQYKNSKACYLCAVGRNIGCFSPETLIALADGSQKQAKDVAVGDKLFNPVTRSAVTVKRVIEGPEPIGLVSIKFKDGELKVSQDHPMLTTNGLKPAKDLKAGEIIFNGDNEKVTVEEAKILPVEEGQWVVNFLLEGADMSKSENRMLLSDGIISGDLQTQLELSSK